MQTLTTLHHSMSILHTTYQHLKQLRKNNLEIENLKQSWAKNILDQLNVELVVTGSVSSLSSLVFIGNHISYLDIPILMNQVSQISFIAKKEVSWWPVFGYAAKKMDTIFVKRENKKSRQLARKSICHELALGKRIVVFPSGTTCMNEERLWKKGIFHLAKENDSFVQPFRLTYYPLQRVSYIDHDFFPIHLYQLLKLKKILAKIEFHEPVKIKQPESDCSYWQNWCRDFPSLFKSQPLQ